MCGIAGSFKPSMFEVLMEGNSVRGNFAMSMMQLRKKRGHSTTKRKGVINFDEVDYHHELKYLIGHTQAPTSAKRSWEYDTSHPFHCGDWMIVHNGVLTNEAALRKQIEGGNTNPVDSSCISMLLEQNSHEFDLSKPEERILAVEKTLEMLQGTFALAIVYMPKNIVYLARQGSVLHVDSKGNFSSLKGADSDYEAIPEGAILTLQKKKWVKVGSFEHQSPFLTL